MTHIFDHDLDAIDLPHFCAEAGHEFVSMSDEGGVQSYLIRCGAHALR